MVMTVISVATPMVSPSIVSDARSLCARRALRHSAKLSRTASMGAEETLQILYRILPGATCEFTVERLAVTLETMAERDSREYDERGAEITSFDFLLSLFHLLMR